MRINSDASSEEGSDSESFHESPVEAFLDEGSKASDLSSGDGQDSDASSNHSSNTSTHNDSDGSGTENGGGDHSEGEESFNSSSEDSEGSGDQTDRSFSSFDPGLDSLIYKDKTIQGTLAPMFARTTGDTEMRTSRKEGEPQSSPAGKPIGGTSVPPKQGDSTESPEVHSSSPTSSQNHTNSELMCVRKCSCAMRCGPQPPPLQEIEEDFSV
jgi:hypothetical protein